MHKPFVMTPSPRNGAPRPCRVCGGPRRPLDQVRDRGGDFPVCDGVLCQAALDKRAQLSTARFEHYLPTVRTLAHRQRETGERREAHLARRRTILRRQERAVRERLTLQAGEGGEGPGPHMVDLPEFASRAVAPSPERVARYERHLLKIVRAAEQPGADEDGHDVEQPRTGEQAEARFAKVPGLRAVSETLCTLCQGGCCPRGKDHAYLKVATARRLLAERPDWNGDDLVAAWLSHRPQEAMKGGCINQTPSGCALPRSLRSGVCNGFFCPPVDEMQAQAVRNGRLGPVVALSREGDYWGRQEPGRDLAPRRVTVITAHGREDRADLAGIAAAVESDAGESGQE